MVLLRLKEVKAITGLGRSSIYKYMNTGNFPKSIQLGERAVAWISDEVDAWRQEKIDLRDENQSTVTVQSVKPLEEADVIAWLKDKLKKCSLAESIEWLMKVIS